MARLMGRPRHIRVTIHTLDAEGKTELTGQLVVAPPLDGADILCDGRFTAFHAAPARSADRCAPTPSGESRPCVRRAAHWYVPLDPMVRLAAPSGNARPAVRQAGSRATCEGVTVANARRTPERTSPLYLWLAALLRDQIEAGHLVAHGPVPSERVLSERYEVSRMTARHALETLTLEGYLYRHPRRGTFVAEPRLRFSVGSFTRNMTEADRTPGTEVLSAATVDPDAVTAGLLGVPVRRPRARAAAPAHRGGGADRDREHPALGGEVPGPARPRPRRLALGAPARALRRVSRRARTRASWP